jgi:hypothetical protein
MVIYRASVSVSMSMGWKREPMTFEAHTLLES